MLSIRFVNIIVGAMVLLLSLMHFNDVLFFIIPLIINKIEDRKFHLNFIFNSPKFWWEVRMPCLCHNFFCELARPIQNIFRHQ